MSAPRNASMTESWIKLMTALGLRSLELVTAGPCLASWEEQLRAEQPVTIRHGDRKNSSRQVDLSSESRATALQAMIALGELSMSQDGHAVAPGTLQRACRLLSKRLAQHGVTVRSLRREFATRQFAHCQAQGLTREESLSRVSAELGCGAGRGVWIWNSVPEASA